LFAVSVGIPERDHRDEQCVKRGLLGVTQIPESDVYDIEESEYVRKAEVDEEIKETRLHGLKDQLAATEGDEAKEQREEIGELEDRIFERLVNRHLE
jgi:hypothetical protein